MIAGADGRGEYGTLHALTGGRILYDGELKLLVSDFDFPDDADVQVASRLPAGTLHDLGRDSEVNQPVFRSTIYR